MKEKWNNFKNNDMKNFEELKDKELSSLFKKDMKDQYISKNLIKILENLDEKNKKTKKKEGKILNQIGLIFKYSNEN